MTDRIPSLFLAGALALAASPAAAADAAGQPASFSIKHMTCEQFGSLPADVQPMVVAWVAGKDHQQGVLDAWVVQVESARRVVSDVTAACRETPRASFRYKVKSVIDRLRAEQKKAAKAGK
ncbi:MAG TPA: HdeA/HdeB family chaperone [Anaeromyxobacteraceae bacterium]|nr:HdeA/HdeB family chaperone [Anaeromyxobacteraceae bacterium]